MISSSSVIPFCRRLCRAGCRLGEGMLLSSHVASGTSAKSNLILGSPTSWTLS